MLSWRFLVEVSSFVDLFWPGLEHVPHDALYRLSQQDLHVPSPKVSTIKSNRRKAFIEQLYKQTARNQEEDEEEQPKITRKRSRRWFEKGIGKIREGYVKQIYAGNQFYQSCPGKTTSITFPS